MFLTTVRVRRARPATLDKHLALPVLNDLRERKAPVIEVMAHGAPVAIVEAASDELDHRVHWRHPALVDFTDDDVVALANPSLGLMAAVHATEITDDGPERPEASPTPMPRRRERSRVTA